MEEYNIVKIDETDFSKLIPLMQNAFGLEVNIDYFKWKFLENPAGKFIGYIAKHIQTNEIAAYYGVIPEKYHLNNEDFLFYQSCDTMTHSSHRRKGLFQLLALKCFEDLKKENQLNIYGFGGSQSTPGFIKMGWEIQSSLITISIPTYLCNCKRNIYNIILTDNLNDDLINFIYSQSLKEKKIQKVLDKEYLLWKFNNPLFNYFFVSTKKKDKTQSVLIYKIENCKLIIIDIFGSENINKLIQFVKRKACSLKLKGIIFYTDTRYKYRYIRYGFIFNPFNIGPLSDKIPFITLTEIKINDWKPSMIEHDAI